jgi:hypothetical protein
LSLLPSKKKKPKSFGDIMNIYFIFSAVNIQIFIYSLQVQSCTGGTTGNSGKRRKNAICVRILKKRHSGLLVMALRNTLRFRHVILPWLGTLMANGALLSYSLLLLFLPSFCFILVDVDKSGKEAGDNRLISEQSLTFSATVLDVHKLSELPYHQTLAGVPDKYQFSLYP